MQEAELARGGERAIGAEAGRGIRDMVEGRVLVVLRRSVDLDELVGGGAACGPAARLADETTQLRGRHELTEARARRGGDGLVDERAAHVVGAGGEQILRHLRSFLYPGRLDIAEGGGEERTGEGVYRGRRDTHSEHGSAG